MPVNCPCIIDFTQIINFSKEMTICTTIHSATSTFTIGWSDSKLTHQFFRRFAMYFDLWNGHITVKFYCEHLTVAIYLPSFDSASSPALIFPTNYSAPGHRLGPLISSTLHSSLLQVARLFQLRQNALLSATYLCSIYVIACLKLSSSSCAT